MGIKGLSTFFYQNPQLSESYRLHDTFVVIDGNNLMHVLYFMHKIECIYNGEYNKYSKMIKTYLSAYLECKITPIIVFDGGYDKSDRKLKTVKQRCRDRLSLTQHIAKYGKSTGRVLPLLAQEVFREVLGEMNIAYAQCDFEADEQLCALANYYKCPIISNDSDFYIYDIQKGFILLDSVEPIVCTDENNGISYCYLDCSIYHIDNFLSHFPGIDKSVLPLFGTLIGNDYVSAGVFDAFFSNIQLPKCKCTKLKVAYNQKKIVGLLAWLKHVNLNDGIKQVLHHLKEEKRARVKSAIDHAVEGYKMQTPNIIYAIEGRLNNAVCDMPLSTDLKAPCGTFLSVNFAFQFHHGHFPPFFLNVINLHRAFLPSQVENVSLESSFACSRFVRQVLYGILLKHDSACESESCLRGIDEYDRRNGNLCRENVNAVFSLRDYGRLPALNELDQFERKKGKKILLETLNVQKHFISLFPAFWKLLFGSLSYWLNSCSPKPKEEIIYAIILNVLYFSLIKPSYFKNVNFIEYCQNEKRRNTSNICNHVAKLNESDLDKVKQNLKKYIKKPVFNNGNPLLINIVHNFSQLQSCILYCVYLNKLLNSPLKCPTIHMTFNGTMLYNLTKEIMIRPFPDLFVSELLGRDSVLDNLFQSLKQAIIDNVPGECLIKSDHSELSKKRKKMKKPEKSSCFVTEDCTEEAVMSNKFVHLNSLTEEENIDF
ncbi:protein asteroid homolog 1-like [Uloborus diversus]|uniref:protein asteroid homolog 1-like n=1 Tax=Uloborus diversus TaxID=327109 RepID=UPI00240A1E33|nr:protein asteroid homolog 1-like [Uloborus diversus]